MIIIFRRNLIFIFLGTWRIYLFFNCRHLYYLLLTRYYWSDCESVRVLPPEQTSLLFICPGARRVSQSCTWLWQGWWDVRGRNLTLFVANKLWEPVYCRYSTEALMHTINGSGRAWHTTGSRQWTLSRLTVSEHHLSMRVLHFYLTLGLASGMESNGPNENIT